LAVKQAKLFVVGHAEVMGGVAVVISCVLVINTFCDAAFYKIHRYVTAPSGLGIRKVLVSEK
jgi:hypothetical protein